MPLSKPDEKKIIIKDDDDRNNCGEDDQEEKENVGSCVTSHLCIKPSHPKQSLDKEVVLRRIRHRKRMNNVKSALKSFIGSSLPVKSTDNTNKASVHGIRWVDDAFAAL